MTGLVEYFATVGVMFLIYCMIRLSFWAETRHPRYVPSSDEGPATAIDIAPLAGRLHQVQGNYAREAYEHKPDFKKPLLIEEKRKEISQLPYFQHLHDREAEGDGAELSAA